MYNNRQCAVWFFTTLFYESGVHKLCGWEWALQGLSVPGVCQPNPCLCPVWRLRQSDKTAATQHASLQVHLLLFLQHHELLVPVWGSQVRQLPDTGLALNMSQNKIWSFFKIFKKLSFITVHVHFLNYGKQ